MRARFRRPALDKVIEVIKNLVEPGREYIIQFGEARTLDQNSYYRGVLIPMFSEYTGYSAREAHRILGQMFLSDIDSKPVPSTSDLTSEQFYRYCEDIRLFLYHEFADVPAEQPRKIVVPIMSQVTPAMLSELDRTYIY